MEVISKYKQRCRIHFPKIKAQKDGDLSKIGRFFVGVFAVAVVFVSVFFFLGFVAGFLVLPVPRSCTVIILIIEAQRSLGLFLSNSNNVN